MHRSLCTFYLYSRVIFLGMQALRDIKNSNGHILKYVISSHNNNASIAGIYLHENPMCARASDICSKSSFIFLLLNYHHLVLAHLCREAKKRKKQLQWT